MDNKNRSDRTHWMSGRYGIMVHWLYPGLLPEKAARVRSFEQAVNQFDLPRFLHDFEKTGASWLIFTFGQNSGYYASPNTVIDQLAGPGHCAEDDLMLDIARGVHDMGKRFIAYLPCEVAGNPSMHQAFAWQTQEGTDQAAFQHRYLTAIREWAERFGSLMDGWWFDGCYTWPIFHNRYMDWSAWFETTRAGNPERVVAFNDGSFCNGLTQPLHPDQDYLSGETELLIDGRIRLGRPLTPQLLAYGDLAKTSPAPIPTMLPEGRFVSGTSCQWHCLLPVDCFWGHGNGIGDWLPADRYHPVDPTLETAPMEPPIYTDDELKGFLHHCLGAGGAVTMNVGIYQEGHLGALTVQQLERIKEGVGSSA